MDKIQTVLTFATTLSVIIVALVQLVKKTVNVRKNFIPFIGLAIGVLIGWAAEPFTDLDVVLRLWSGGLAGLSATGLFELTNNRTGNTKDVDNT